ncbi:rab11 family-interacting protein 2 isoform X3 [Tribolium madens]|uniref:rab11 family-interacting protein 2 isoform X3 n=1 Tax=Tribolium madens TaxID=41895 RepID=UPI001CF74415|nr:rab11 family-interacting protein 2 isoform X3 [Tribolium madens]
MWMPTHVQVTVQRAAGLLTKGKNKTNDCFVTIALGKTKYQTSIKEKADPDVEWHEECELPIPDQGNTAEIILTALHHNSFGVDEFLGRVAIPLNTLDIYERPKNKWYGLEAKPGKVGKAKERGHLEVKIGFTVKSGSLTDLSKKEKHKSSIGQLSHVAQSVGGSLLSLGSAEKRKGIKKFAKSIGSKMHLRGKKKDGDLDDSSSIGSVGSLKRNFDKFKSRQTKEDADPGVVSDEDDFTFDDLSHKSSVSSLNQPTNHNNSVSSTENISGDILNKTPPVKPPRNENKPQDEWESKLFGKQTNKNLLKPASSESLNRRSWDSSKLESQIEEEPPEMTVTKDDISVNPTKTPEVVKKEERDGMLAKLKNFRKGGEKEVNYSSNNHISNELLQKFEGKSREDLIHLVCNLQSDLESQKKKLKDLEDYLDDLLLRVMETTPRILQNPYVTCKLSHKNG